MTRAMENKINYRQHLLNQIADIEKEIKEYLNKKYPDMFEFEWGDELGEIKERCELPEDIEERERGIYIKFFNKSCINDEWYSSGIIYVPMEDDFYLEVHFSG